MQILVIEDEVLLALDLEQMLNGMGHDVVASAATVEDGERYVESKAFDLAIVDINLAGRSSEPVVRRLKEKGVPFFLATGYAATILSPDLATLPYVSKPYNASDLQQAIALVKPPQPKRLDE